MEKNWMQQKVKKKKINNEKENAGEKKLENADETN